LVAVLRRQDEGFIIVPSIFSKSKTAGSKVAQTNRQPDPLQKALKGPVKTDFEVGEGENPQKSSRRQAAIALHNDKSNDRTPTIVAQGYGKLAEAILALAFENDVKVREDPDLAEVLMSVELGEDIPIEAFAAVAEILSYLYLANLELGQDSL